MDKSAKFEQALNYMREGDYHSLRAYLCRYPKLVKQRDETRATLLIRLIDYPGHLPNAEKTARILLVAGSEVDARRDDQNGTALSGVISTEEADVARVLLEFGASFKAKLGFRDGIVLHLAQEIIRSRPETDSFSRELKSLVADYTGWVLC